MKKIASVSYATFLCITCLFGQRRTETIRVKGNEASDFIAKTEYKFPSFTQAKVYLKNGDVASGKFNYDYFDQVIKYIDEKGDTLAVSNGKDINYITTGVDTFFYDNNYYEWIAGSATAKLAIRRTFKLTDKEKIGAYGMSSPTNNIESHNAILDITNHQLSVNEELVFSKETTYYISSMNAHFTEANKKNISKLFPDKNIEAFINQKKLNLNKEEDLLDVFVYANRP